MPRQHNPNRYRTSARATCASVLLNYELWNSEITFGDKRSSRGCNQHSSLSTATLHVNNSSRVCARPTTKHPFTAQIDGIWLLECYSIRSYMFFSAISFCFLMLRDMFMDNMTNDINYFLEGNAQTVTHSILYSTNEEKTVLFMHESKNMIMVVVSR